jgi:hypothetical protein
MSSSQGVETLSVNHAFKQLEEMATSLRHERYELDELAAALSLEPLDYTDTACREQGEATETSKSPSMRSKPQVEVVSLPARLVDRDMISSEQDEEEEPLTPLFGLSDIWQTKASTSTQDAYKAMAVPSMDISTCVGSDVDPASFNHSCEGVEDLGTSFMDEGNEACVTYAMSEGGSSFADQCNDIDDMYDQLENYSHLPRERTKERRLRKMLKSMWKESLPKASNAKQPKESKPRKTGLRKDGGDMLHELLSSQLH